MSKKTSIFELSNETQKRIAQPDEWMNFLKTSSNHYKSYSFSSQMLIYAQRPDATACATFDDWQKFGRHVKRNSKGIALIDESKMQLELNYVFDVKDTYGKDPGIWQMKEEHMENVKETLSNAYGLSDADMELSFESFVLKACKNIADDNMEEYFNQLMEKREECPNLAAFTDEEIKSRFHALLQYSVAYSVLQRAGVEANDKLFRSRFLDIDLFGDNFAITALGEAERALSKEVLREIEHTVKGYNKTRDLEMERVNDEHHISESERVPDSGFTHAGTEENREVRDDEKTLSGGSETGDLPGDVNRRDIDESSLSDGDGSESDVRDRDGEAFGTESGTGKREEQLSVDETYGKFSENRGGTGRDRSDSPVEKIPDDAWEYAFLHFDQNHNVNRAWVAYNLRKNTNDNACAVMLGYNYEDIDGAIVFPDGTEGKIEKTSDREPAVISLTYGSLKEERSWADLLPMVRTVADSGNYLDFKGEDEVKEFALRETEYQDRWIRHQKFSAFLSDNGIDMSPKNIAAKNLAAYIYENSETGRAFLENAIESINVSADNDTKALGLELLGELGINQSFLSDEEILPSATDAGIDAGFISERESLELLNDRDNYGIVSQDVIDFVLKTAMTEKSKQDVYLFYQENPSKKDGISFLYQAFQGEERDYITDDGNLVTVESNTNGLIIDDSTRMQVTYAGMDSRIRSLIRYDAYLSLDELVSITKGPEKQRQELYINGSVTLAGNDYKIVDLSEKHVALQDKIFPIFTKVMDRNLLDRMLNQDDNVSLPVSVIDAEDSPLLSDFTSTIAEDTTVLVEHILDDVEDGVVTEEELEQHKPEVFRYLALSDKENLKQVGFNYPNEADNPVQHVFAYGANIFHEKAGLWVRGHAEYLKPLSEDEITVYGFYPYTHHAFRAEDGKVYDLTFARDDSGISIYNEADDNHVVCHLSKDFVPDFVMDDIPDQVNSILDSYLLSCEKYHLSDNQLLSVKDTETYRYYSPMRPISPGSIPNKENKAVNIHNFDEREYVPLIQKPAWGYAEYPAPLSEKEADDYELILAPTPIKGDKGEEYVLDYKRISVGIQVINRMEEADESANLLAVIRNSGDITYMRNDLPDAVIHEIQDEAAKRTHKQRKTADNRNFEWLKKYAPEIVDKTYDYMRFENPDKDSGYMPLYIEWIDNETIAMAHSYTSYGDVILDPEMTFHMDLENREMKPLSFEMSGVMYQRVYEYHDSDYQNPDKSVLKDMQSFLNAWKKNISEQSRERSLAKKDGISFTFMDGVAKAVDTSDPTIRKEADAIETAAFSDAESIIGNLKDMLDMYAPNDPDFLEEFKDVKEEIDSLFNLSFMPDNDVENREAIANLSSFLLEWAPDLVDSEEKAQFDNILNSAVTYLESNEGKRETEKDLTLFDFPLEPYTEAPVIEEKELPFAVPYAQGERINFKTAEDSVNLGGPKARFQYNVDAIKLLKTLEEENRLASPDEMTVLSRYVGWGGLSMAFDDKNEAWKNEYDTLKALLTDDEYAAARESTLTAFYTPPEVTGAIFKAIEDMGFKKGNILDPCCGTGNFFGALPEGMKESKLYGVEKDGLSGRIAKQLYQKSNIEISGFEKTNLPDSFFDVAIGNVPFGDFKLTDKRYDKENFLIHDYFFAKTLDKVRPGGVIAFVTSKGTMDKTNPKVREYIAERADLLGAVRLPNSTFKQNAGTEVTSDIIFLQKREEPRISEADWVHTVENADGIPMNEYFYENPHMILGEMKRTTGIAGRETFECIADKAFNLKDELNRALSHIHAEYIAHEYEEFDSERADERKTLPAPIDVKNFSFTEVDGEVYFRENSIMYPAELNATAEKRVKGMIALRSVVNDLIDAQLNDADDAEVKELQEKLDKAYDKFTKEFGIINSRANELAFSQDSSYFLLCSLENVDSKGEFESKADIFYKRTIGRSEEISHCDTPIEALMVSIAETGRVNFSYMQKLLDYELSFEEIKDALKGQIFRDPTLRGEDYNCYLPADEYLSGNVRKKLHLAEAAAEVNPDVYSDNVTYLTQVLPEWIEPGNITATLGSTWIPDVYIDEFFKVLLKVPDYSWINSKQQVHYSELTNAWKVDNKSWHSSEMATVTYGTDRWNAAELLECTLNLKTPEVFDYIYDPDTGRDKRVRNAEETIRAIEKQEMIQKEFDKWVWSDTERRDHLAEIYNERFNCIRNREYNGDNLKFHGMNPSIELKKHQKDAVARIIQGGNTMLAHAVGAGKTFEMVTAAMEMKAMGLSKKNMVVVPNHLIKQFAAEALQLYPAANILGSTKKDFEPRNRKKFCSRIATGDYDLVIIGHSQFEKIPLSKERQMETIKNEIDEIIQGIELAKMEENESFSVKQMERTKKSLEEKLEKLNDDSRKDDVITFEQLGIDRLFVDEAHNYKNLFINTKMTRVAGLSTTSSQKSMDMFMKCRYMDEKTGNRGNIHATGTPVSNSLVELYTTQRYLQYDMLVDLKLHHFDAWASAFGQQKVVMELAPEGTGYRMRNRFAKFHNIPELMAIYKECADVKPQDVLNLDVPEAHYEVVVTKPSEIQKSLVEELGHRAERIRSGGVDVTEDNMLLVTNDGRKLALDQRLIDPDYPDDSDSKVNACADKIAEVYHKTDSFKGTQLVFCDLSTPQNKTVTMKENKDGVYEAEAPFTNVYDDLKDKLIKRGVPADEIRFIHEANTEIQKENMFEKVRNGEIRVLMGSTQKMGAGTNVQQRLYAIHDLDCPWRPSDLEQRSGRIVRQGNTNTDVYIYRYVTENTFDAYLFQLLENKQRFVSQIMTSKSPVRVADDIDEVTISFAELKALAAGNPLIKERTELDIELQRLRSLKSDFLNEKFQQENRIQTYYPKKIMESKEKIKGYEADLEYAKSVSKPHSADSEPPKMIIDGVEYSRKNVEDMFSAIGPKLKGIHRGDIIPIGTYEGFAVLAKKGSLETIPDTFYLEHERRYEVSFGKMAGVFTRFENELPGGIMELYAKEKNRLQNLETDLENAISEVNTPFHREAELAEKEARLKELDELLSIEDNSNKGDNTELRDVTEEKEEIVNDVNDVRKRKLDELIADAKIRQDGTVPGSDASHMHLQK